MGPVLGGVHKLQLFPKETHDFSKITSPPENSSGSSYTKIWILKGELQGEPPRLLYAPSRSRFVCRIFHMNVPAGRPVAFQRPDFGETFESSKNSGGGHVRPFEGIYRRPLRVVKFVRGPGICSGPRTRASWLKSWSW